MKSLQTGEFYGVTNTNIQLGSLTVTDTEYTHDYVDWHYHENAYFTFILAGKVLEGNKKEIYHCPSGGLLFHHWQEAHYNIKPKGFTRGFHVELKPDWFSAHGLSADCMQGSYQLQDPHLKRIMYNIFKEVKLDDCSAALAVDTLLLKFFDIATTTSKSYVQTPPWVNRIKDLLHDNPAFNWSLKDLAHELGIHPVHLSRDFPRHFKCNLGEYIRQLRVQKALSMLSQNNSSLTAIAANCGFADQSHFIRSFKSLHQITPLSFKKLMR